MVNSIGLHPNPAPGFVMPGEMEYGIPTMNSMGYAATNIDRYSKSFVRFAARCKAPVLDIGAAYGTTSLKALANGATVVCNDLESKHLQLLEARCPVEHRKNLTIIAGDFLILDFQQNQFGAILASRVIHYMNGENIRKMLNRCYYYLQIGGKLFLTVTTPYCKEAEPFIPIYEKNIQDGVEWPGLVANTRSVFDLENIGPFFHFLDPKTLRRELENSHFIVKECTYFARTDLSETARYDGREGMAAIAIKQ